MSPSGGENQVPPFWISVFREFFPWLTQRGQMGYIGILVCYFVHRCLFRGKNIDACVDGPPAARRWHESTDDRQPKPPPWHSPRPESMTASPGPLDWWYQSNGPLASKILIRSMDSDQNRHKLFCYLVILNLLITMLLSPSLRHRSTMTCLAAPKSRRLAWRATNLLLI